VSENEGELDAEITMLVEVMWQENGEDVSLPLGLVIIPSDRKLECVAAVVMSGSSVRGKAMRYGMTGLEFAVDSVTDRLISTVFDELEKLPVAFDEFEALEALDLLASTLLPLLEERTSDELADHLDRHPEQVEGWSALDTWLDEHGFGPETRYGYEDDGDEDAA
jgi:hypothetical protein